MEEPIVLRCDKVVHKNARTEDDEPIGYIAAEGGDSFIVLAGHFREYQIPKSHVRAFYVSQVHLDLPFREFGQYRV